VYFSQNWKFYDIASFYDKVEKKALTFYLESNSQKTS